MSTQQPQPGPAVHPEQIAGLVERVNVSATTWNLVSPHFACTPRGAIFAKNLGELDMFFIDSETDGSSPAGQALNY